MNSATARSFLLLGATVTISIALTGCEGKTAEETASAEGAVASKAAGPTAPPFSAPKLAACRRLGHLLEGGMVLVGSASDEGTWTTELTSSFFTPTRKLYVPHDPAGAMTNVSDLVTWSLEGTDGCREETEKLTLEPGPGSEPSGPALDRPVALYHAKGKAIDAGGKAMLQPLLTSADGEAIRVLQSCKRWFTSPGALDFCSETEPVFVFDGACEKHPSSAICRAIKGKVLRISDGGKEGDTLSLVETSFMDPKDMSSIVQPPPRPVRLVAHLHTATAPEVE